MFGYFEMVLYICGHLIRMCLDKMGKESNLIPAKKGEVRNPKGRVKGSLNRKTILRHWLSLEQDEKNPITKQVETLSQVDLITLAIIKKAREGDVNAYKTLMEWGTDYNETDETQKIIVEIVDPKPDTE